MAFAISGEIPDFLESTQVIPCKGLIPAEVGGYICPDFLWYCDGFPTVNPEVSFRPGLSLYL
jgi:hypothetical protein